MNKKLTIVVLLMVIAGSGAWLYYTQFREPNVDVDTYEALGIVTAEETAKLLGNKGAIVLISWETRNRVLEAQITSFARAIKHIEVSIFRQSRKLTGIQRR